MASLLETHDHIVAVLLRRHYSDMWSHFIHSAHSNSSLLVSHRNRDFFRHDSFSGFIVPVTHSYSSKMKVTDRIYIPSKEEPFVDMSASISLNGENYTLTIKQVRVVEPFVIVQPSFVPVTTKAMSFDPEHGIDELDA